MKAPKNADLAVRLALAKHPMIAECPQPCPVLNREKRKATLFYLPTYFLPCG